MQTKQRLDALTSLRFLAAAMIVIHHSGGLFGLSTASFFSLGQGVSFFFVLSGFILAYVYPKLDTWSEIKRFWYARIARIWPALFFSFLLAFWLLSLDWDYKIASANLFMVNAWIPLPVYFFSYNWLSWSISTEFFFYLAFPFLIQQWDKTWLVKLLASGIMVVFLILVSNWLQLPVYNSINDGVTIDALVYIHPISRIFEFIFGIFVASCWRKKVAYIQWSEATAFLYEIGAIFLVCISLRFSPLAAGWFSKTETWQCLPAEKWLLSSGSMFVFGLLIYVIAIGRGRITALLSHPILVLLGEISFSLYLLHQILLRYYQANIAFFSHLPNILSLAIFWVIVLLASYLMWALIEMPGRRLLLRLGGQRKIHGTKIMRESWHSHLNLNRNTLSAATVLVCLLVSIYFSMENINRISPSDADVMTSKELKSVMGTRFGNLFALRGVKIEHQADGLHITLAWESLVDQKLSYTNGIHLTDADGNTLLQADYKQPMSRMDVKQGVIWKDEIFIPKNKLKGNESKLAIALYQNSESLLLVNQGDRDWGGKRLIIPITKGAAATPEITPLPVIPLLENETIINEAQFKTTAKFGDYVSLLAIRSQPSANGDKSLDMVFKADRPLPAGHHLAVHIATLDGTVLAKFDSEIVKSQSQKKGEQWVEHVQIPAASLTHDTVRLGLAIYADPQSPLSITYPTTDYGGKRMLIDLSAIIPPFSCSQGACELIVKKSPLPSAAKFGNYISLLAIQVQSQKNGDQFFDMVFKVEQPLPSEHKLAVHIVTADGTIVGKIDAPIVNNRALKSGNLWLEHIQIPARFMTPEAVRLGLAIYNDPAVPLSVEYPTVDYGGKRMLVDLTMIGLLK